MKVRGWLQFWRGKRHTGRREENRNKAGTGNADKLPIVLRVRKKSRLVRAMITELSDGAELTLKGDLSQVKTVEAGGGCLTSEGNDGVAVFPLRKDTLASVLAIIERVGIVNRVQQIEIRKNRVLQFVSYDWLHDGMTLVDEGLPCAFLDQLVADGILSGYEHNAH